MSTPFKLIAFDLDGTFLRSDKSISERSLKCIETAARMGIEVVPTTGRPLSGVPKEIMNLPYVRYIISANGGRVVDLKEDKVLYEQLLPVEICEKVLDIFFQYDTLREIYFDGIGYAEEDRLENILHFLPEPAMAGYIKNTRVGVADVKEKFKEEYRDMDKMQAIFADMDERAKAWQQIKDQFQVELTGAIGNNIEVNAVGVNKGQALTWLGQQIGVEPDEMMAFGDGSNDVQMLRVAGVGVAMGNAIEEVKAAANMVTLTNDEEGVAYMVETCVLAQKGNESC